MLDTNAQTTTMNKQLNFTEVFLETLLHTRLSEESKCHTCHRVNTHCATLSYMCRCAGKNPLELSTLT